MELSIIIPSFNTKTLLDRCLRSTQESLRDSSLNYEIIVVDNASTDGTIELLKTKYPRVIKIFNKTNVGYGKGNNQGIQKATGKYILLLNSDIQVLNNAVVDLYKFAQKYPHAFVGGKLLNEDQTSQASCGPMYTLPIVFLMLFAKGDAFGVSRSSPTKVSMVDWVSGACIIGPKDVFLTVGLFDEKIFMYMEEIDLLYRAKQKGYATIFYPGARFIHSGAASSGNRRKPVVNIYRGLLYFYRKHRSIMEQWMLILLLRAKAYIAIALGKLTGNASLIETYEQALEMV